MNWLTLIWHFSDGGRIPGRCPGHWPANCSAHAGYCGGQDGCRGGKAKAAATQAEEPFLCTLKGWFAVEKRRVLSKGLAAGLDPDRFAGHGLRAGLATAAALADVPEHAIMRQTRHRSVEVFRGYVRVASLFKKNASARRIPSSFCINAAQCLIS